MKANKESELLKDEICFIKGVTKQDIERNLALGMLTEAQTAVYLKQLRHAKPVGDAYALKRTLKTIRPINQHVTQLLITLHQFDTVRYWEE